MLDLFRRRTNSPADVPAASAGRSGVATAPIAGPAELRPHEDAFIEAQVQFQLGNWAFEPAIALDPDAVRECARAGHDHLVLWSAATNSIEYAAWPECLRFARGKWTRPKADPAHAVPRAARKMSMRSARTVNELLPYAKRASYCIDMRDARVTGLQHETAPIPCFQYNRPPFNRSAILWPLASHHDIGTSSFVPAQDDAERFEAKIPKAIWRGALAGAALLDGERAPTHRILGRFRSGALEEARAVEALRQTARYRVVEQAQRSELVDARLVLTSKTRQWADAPFVTRLIGDALDRQHMMRYRYLLCLEGYDIATSLFWSLTADSVVLKQEYPWEVFADVHLRPWQHYVPVAADIRDIEDKIGWCEQRPEVCRQIIDNAHAVCRLLARSDLRQRALGAVVARYESAWQRP